VLGHDVDLSALNTAGMTDAEICVMIAASGRRDRGPDILRAYARLVPDALHSARAASCPNVPEILDALAGRDDVVNMLLTGNVAEGAEAKLRHYGLWQHFGAGGAYSVEGSDRPSIAREAASWRPRTAAATGPTATRWS
jgi:hypothetical protein